MPECVFATTRKKKLRSSIFGYIYFSTEPAQYSKQCSYPSNQGCQQNEKQYVMVSNPYDYSQTDTSVNILSSFGSSSIFIVYANDIFKNSQIKETKERTHIQSTLFIIYLCMPLNIWFRFCFRQGKQRDVLFRYK